jgi:lysophospholipase L1-like esterase
MAGDARELGDELFRRETPAAAKVQYEKIILTNLTVPAASPLYQAAPLVPMRAIAAEAVKLIRGQPHGDINPAVAQMALNAVTWTPPGAHDRITSDEFGRLSRYAEANAALVPRRPGETRVVFFGDSITDNWSRDGFGGFFPGKPYVNRGISGQTTSQMLLRFRADVIALRPVVVVILAGTNDVAGNTGPVALDVIEQNLASMAELAKAHGIRIVLASLLPVSDDKRDKSGAPLVRTAARPPASLHALNAWMADYARRNGHVYLDYLTPMADEKGALKAALTDDGLHPNAAGYAVMAPLAERAIAQALGRGAGTGSR